jgi:predicted Zn finger-like uncharacterized protein
VYTRCPECKTTYRIGIGELRAGRGEVLCNHCRTFFNALSFLSMNTGDSPDSDLEPARPAYTPVLGGRNTVMAPDEVDGAGVPETENGAGMFASDRSWRKRRSEPLSAAEMWRWGGGALALLVLLCAQIAGFEGERLVQDIHVRPMLDRFCAILRCTLPPFKDLDRIRIVDRALSIAQDGRDAFEFRLIFANQSELPQAFPQLRLVLNELNGYPVAERVFRPSEYLENWRSDITMPVGRPFEVRLSIARPSKDVGGFLIEFQ